MEGLDIDSLFLFWYFFYVLGDIGNKDFDFGHALDMYNWNYTS